MPTYAYRCTVCGHDFDTYQSFSDPVLTECPECTGLLRKVLHPVGVVFKGSGFYRTDNAKTTGGAKSSGSGSGSGSKSDSGSSGTTAAKPAAS